MFVINQYETNTGQIVCFKSQTDSQRYWNFFIENKNVIPFQYVNPLLIAGKGYTYTQIQKLDFLKEDYKIRFSKNERDYKNV